MWKSEIFLEKIYRATGGQPHDDSLEDAYNNFIQPTPSAQSVENFVEGAGQNTVNAIVDDVLAQLDEPQKRRRTGPLFSEETSAAGSSAAGSSAAGSSTVGTSAAGTSAAGSSVAGTSADGSSTVGTSEAGSHTVPPNIVETSNFTFSSHELNSMLKKEDLELKEYLIEYFKYLLKIIKSRKDISWYIIAILKKKKIIEMFGTDLRDSSLRAAEAGGQYFYEFINILESIVK